MLASGTQQSDSAFRVRAEALSRLPSLAGHYYKALDSVCAQRPFSRLVALAGHYYKALDSVCAQRPFSRLVALAGHYHEALDVLPELHSQSLLVYFTLGSCVCEPQTPVHRPHPVSLW